MYKRKNMKNYLLLNNILLNLENRRDFLLLNDFTSEDICSNDYKYINVITKFLQKEDQENSRLIIGSYFIRIPYFIDILKRTLVGIEIVPLFQIACNQFNTKGDFIFTEIYDNIIIKTIYKNNIDATGVVKQKKISNRNDPASSGECSVEIYHQQVINYSIISSLLSKLEPYFDVNVTDKQKIEFINFIGINMVNSSLDYENYDKNDLIYVNFKDWGLTKEVIKDSNFTIDLFYKMITEDIIENCILNERSEFNNIIFSPLLFFKYIDFYFSNYNLKHVDLENCPDEMENVTISGAEFNFQAETEVVFTDEQSLWIISELNTEILLKRKVGEKIGEGRFMLPEKILDPNIFKIGDVPVVKFLLKAKPDIFNNIHLHLEFSNNKSILSLIEFTV